MLVHPPSCYAQEVTTPRPPSRLLIKLAPLRDHGRFLRQLVSNLSLVVYGVSGQGFAREALVSHGRVAGASWPVAQLSEQL
jgi:hypothetical protein